MAEYDLIWDNTITTEWGNGAFLGNGLLGAMICGDRENPQNLQWELGRTDVCAHYKIEGIDWNMPRVFIGELVLKPAGLVTSRSMRLDVAHAEATGAIITDRGRIDWRSFIPREENVIITEMRTAEGEDAAVGEPLGGALAGVAGASLSIALLNVFQQNLTNGLGFIAIALVYFGGWRPVFVLAGSLIFSLINALQVWVQVIGIPIPSDIAVMMPYILTIIVLIISSNRVRQPAALNKPYERTG